MSKLKTVGFMRSGPLNGCWLACSDTPMWNVTRDANGTELFQITNVVSGCDCAKEFNVNLTLNAHKKEATGVVTSSTVYRSVTATTSFNELHIDFRMVEENKWSESHYCVSGGADVLGIAATQCTSAGEALLAVFIPIICIVFVVACLLCRYRKSWECYTDKDGEPGMRWKRNPPHVRRSPLPRTIQHDSMIPEAQMVRNSSLTNGDVPMAKIVATNEA